MVSNYCEEQKKALNSLDVFFNMQNDFGNKFWIFGNFLATSKHSSKQLSSILDEHSRDRPNSKPGIRFISN